MDTFSLEKYLNNGVENIVKGIIKASMKNPQESLFLMQYAIESKKAAEIRRQKENCGHHIPPFLIASITNQCNLHCKGCYARANHSCGDLAAKDGVLDAKGWSYIFMQAVELGISFILLAGGEPFMRRDVIEEAGKQRKILFPIFTNGTMITEEYRIILKKYRNLIPILSIEGKEETTNERRGDGVYQALKKTMDELDKQGILFGASVTVNKKNRNEVLSDDFIHGLAEKGCKGIVYVEYVPVDHSTQALAIDDEERMQMLARLNQLRMDKTNMLFVAFPGDEKSSGGCLAAGRGFFHINANGGAEPCPFSPYSDTSLKDVTLEEALASPLFRRLKENGNLEQEHIGGCVLFEQEDVVKQLLRGE